MPDDFLVLNIKEYLQRGERGEHLLRRIFSTFSCKKNIDVERFLVNQAIAFAKKNQSVTYLVFSLDKSQMLGYFTLAVKPIAVNSHLFSNTMKRKIQRVSEAPNANGDYLLAAYLIAQVGKNFQNGAAEKRQKRRIDSPQGEPILLFCTVFPAFPTILTNTLVGYMMKVPRTGRNAPGIGEGKWMSKKRAAVGAALRQNRVETRSIHASCTG